MKAAHIIFDLDGTLIDSSASILNAFHGAFDSVGLKPIRPFTSEIIGPPLKTVLAQLSGANDSILLDELAVAFKALYDTEGYRQTAAFPGVSNMLAELCTMKIPLYIATNKRLKPTLLILEHLQWLHYFSCIYALDSLNPPAKDKTTLLNHIMKRHHFDPHTTYYIGDRIEDCEAAMKNKMPFAFASWGYGENRPKGDAIKAYNTPIKLLMAFLEH